MVHDTDVNTCMHFFIPILRLINGQHMKNIMTVSIYIET